MQTPEKIISDILNIVSELRDRERKQAEFSAVFHSRGEHGKLLLDQVTSAIRTYEATMRLREVPTEAEGV